MPSSLFLLIMANQFKTRQWLYGFLAMLVPYCFLLVLGNWGDSLVYKVAKFRHERGPGGGVAFAHLLIFLYAFGGGGFAFSVFGYFGGKMAGTKATIPQTHSDPVE